MSKALFISDLHLSSDRPDTVSLFLRFLKEVAPGGERLYILGDLFDVWIGDDNTAYPIPTIIEALQALCNKGIKVFLLHGNRDFLIGEQFCQSSGCILLPDPSVVELNGNSILLMHGDLLCSNDHNYQATRKRLRDPQFAKEFLPQPIEQRAQQAAGFRKQSGAATSKRTPTEMDVVQETVIEEMKKHHCQWLIHGHTHRPGEHHFDLDGVSGCRVVLPEWHEQEGGYLIASGTNFKAEMFS